MKKTLATLLSSTLVILSPGLISWAAAADVVRGNVSGRGIPAVSIPSIKTVAIPQGLGVSMPGVNVNVALPAAQVNALPAAAAKAAAAATPNLQTLVQQQAALSLTSEQAAQMPAAQAAETGAKIMDTVLGTQSLTGTGSSDVPAVAGTTANMAPLGRANGGSSYNKPPVPPNNNNRTTNGGDGNGPRRGKVAGFLLSVGKIVLAGAAVVGIQAGAVALAPAIFGLAPVAAVWAVSSGILLLPAAVYARYRLSRRDSPRLNKVKTLLDVAIGAYIGAAVVAFPAASMVLAAQGASIGLPLAAVAGAGSLVSMMSGGSAVDVVLTGTALAALPVVLGVGVGALGVAPIIGMLALPAMTTIAFFLGPIISAAESGRPFSVPGSLQKFRFPSFNWVMIGVVFALTTGYSAVYANMAFLAWNLFGSKGLPKWEKGQTPTKNILNIVLNFNTAFLGLLAYTAFTGFASPLTFLVIAFAGERFAVLTEGLLAKFLPASEAAPSTAPADDAKVGLTEKIERKWPAFHHWAKTFIMIGAMATMAFGMGYWVVGIGSLMSNLGVAALLTALPLFFSKQLIKAVMKLQPATEESDPEFYEIMKGLQEDINAGLEKKGKKAIPLPELTISPTDIPNAAATGLSPYKSLVFVTQGIKTMLLDPEELRDGLIRLLGTVKETSDEYKVFRTGLVGTIPGVTQQSTPQEAAQAIVRADAAQLKTLGTRLLRGVLAHEFSHVMDRHMVTGTIGGAISSGVAFASYGVMWAVGHAKVTVTKLKDRILGRTVKVQEDPEVDENRPGMTDPRRGAKPEMLEPLSTGIVLKSLPALIRVFVALWAPIILQITQMAGSRNNEAQADEDGALLSKDPAALALALGLLTTWRPRGFAISGLQLPRLAAVSHMMTVNPLQQLQAAGALPKNDAMPVTKADNFMLNLFLTHPDTMWRIRTLKRMADALGQDLNPPAPPPGGGGGGGPQTPPLASLAPKNAPAESRGVSFGAVRGAWNKMFRVLPDPSRNREFWKFVWGQALVNIGGSFHYSALSKLLAPKPELAKNVTDNRALNSAAQLSSSLILGPELDRGSIQKMLVWTYFGRAVLMASVPILFFHGFYFIAAFHTVIFLAGFLQSAGMNAGSVAFNRILADDTAYYNKANAVFNVIVSAVGVLAPLAAGAFIVAMDARFGLLAGNALAYAVYGALLLATGVLYMTLKIPRDELLQARRDLADTIKGVPGVRGVRAENGKLIVETKGDPASIAGQLPTEFEGYPVEAAQRNSRFGELIDGFRLIWKDRFLRIYLLFTTFSVMMADPIVFSALPRYISDVLHVQGAAQGAAFSWYLAAASLGTGTTSLAMMFMRDKSASDFEALIAHAEKAQPGSEQALRAALDKTLSRYKENWKANAKFDPSGSLTVDLIEAARAELKTELAAASEAELEAWAQKHERRLIKQARSDATSGLTALERQGRWSSILHGAGWLMYLVIFFSPWLSLSIAAMAVALALSAPALTIWSSLLQKSITDRNKENMGKIYSALFFYQLAFAIVGALLFGWVMSHFSTHAALLISGGVMIFMALLDVLEPWVIFKKRK